MRSITEFLPRNPPQAAQLLINDPFTQLSGKSLACDMRALGFPTYPRVHLGNFHDDWLGNWIYENDRDPREATTPLIYRKTTPPRMLLNMDYVDLTGILLHAGPVLAR